MTRDDVLNKAISYIKNTPYSNPNDFTKWYFKDNKSHAWCGAFIDYIIKHDLGSDILDSCSNFAYVPTIYRWAKEKGYFNSDFKKGQKGDLVIFNWHPESKNNYSHIGIVESVKNDAIISIDGNTSYGNYDKNCVARKTRNKKYIVGIVQLPYKEEEMDFNIGDYVWALEDINLYTSIEYKTSTYTLKKGDKAWVRYTKGMNVALANPDTHEYFSSAWTNQLDKLTKEEPQEDYKKLYEEQLEKNLILQNKVYDLQDKINKAIADLQ